MIDSRIKPPSLRSALFAVAGAPILGSLAVAWIPALHQRFLRAPPVCWSKLLLHHDCAGCGLTRSFVAIAGGDIHAGARWNPLGPAFYLYLCVMTLAAAGEILFPRFRWWKRLEGVATLATLAWAGIGVLAFYFG